ncbi:hypothetical protein AB205_0189400 [Aquarana catesbeiana]|uniref:Uncharacterized protein n=1 Tax=Aquarana catesbeiana TaxID=8400 RepID=A0A2G9SEN8_AQUCT|nr:hypothetical protein AB205_0189400 [Aquarana catesbeiana]
MEPAVLTFLMMVPSFGQEVWTTLCDPGTCVKDDSYNNMTSHHRSSPWDTVQLVNGWQWAWRTVTWRCCMSPSQINTSYIFMKAVYSPSSLLIVNGL